MRIVVIEPDVALGLFLKKGLTLEGHHVSWTDRSNAALDMAESSAPDLIILDIGAEGGLALLTTRSQLNNRTAHLAQVSNSRVEQRRQSGAHRKGMPAP